MLVLICSFIIYSKLMILRGKCIEVIFHETFSFLIDIFLDKRLPSLILYKRILRQFEVN